MGLFRKDDERIEIIKGGCPICHSDVKGNDLYLYFCEKCDILFKKIDLRISPEHVEGLMKQSLAKKIMQNKPIIEELKPIKEKQIEGTKKIILEDRRKKIYYFSSKKSNVVHASNCPYAKNIKLSNRIRYKSLANTSLLKRCKCITEIK